MNNRERKKVFSVLITHNENFLWLLYIFVASLSGVIGLSNNGVDYFYSKEMYFISLSIISPLLVDFIIQNLEYKKQNISNRFLKRKTLTIGISFFVIILIILGLCIRMNNLIHIILQSLIFITAVILSLYMFCLQKLILYGDEYSELDDKSYNEEINSKGNELSKQQKKLKNLKNESGRKIKL